VKTPHLPVTLSLHPRTPPIARANVHAAEAVRRWAESRPERATPQRQDAALIQTEPFRYD
jgi:hypothetical protein